MICVFFFYCYGDHRDLHSFPTRRSSDLVMRRTRTFVSTARMPLPRVAPDTRLELVERLPLWGARGEDRPMDILGGVAPRSADDNGAAVVASLEDGARANAKAPADRRRDGHMALGGEPRVGNRRHTYQLPW